MSLQATKEAVLKFWKDESGLTVVEYAVAGGLVWMAVVGAFTALSGAVGGEIGKLCIAVKGGACP